MKSWSAPFGNYVARQRLARQFTCVRCGDGPAMSIWKGEHMHLRCLTREERSMWMA